MVGRPSRSGRAGQVAVLVDLGRRGRQHDGGVAGSRQLFSSVSGAGVPRRRSAGPRSTRGPASAGPRAEPAAARRRPAGAARRPRLTSSSRSSPSSRVEPAQHERLGAEHGAVEPRRPLDAERRVLAAQPQQVAVQRQRLGVRAPSRSAGSSFERANVSRSAGWGSRACISGVARLGNCERNSRRPRCSSVGRSRAAGR